MKLLIIGNSSVVGMRLRSELSERHEVLTAGRDGAADVFFDLERGGESTFPTSVDAIIHCAASFRGNLVDEMLENELVNAVGALRAAKVAQATACRHVVFISTISTLDHPENGYFGSYGLSKRHAQENLQLWCKEARVAFTALLPSQIYDEAGLERKHQPLLYHIVDCARRAHDVVLYGAADPLRNYLFIGDLAKAVEKVVSLCAQGVFPCLAPESHRLSEVARIAFEVFGTKAKITRLRDKPDIPSIYIPRDDTLFDATGYRPATGIRDGLTKIRDNNTQLT